MPFKKGKSGNPAGRPIGSRNKKEVPQAIADLMEELATTAMDDLEELDARDRLELFIKLYQVNIVNTVIPVNTVNNDYHLQ